MTQLFATFDPANMGLQLALSQSNTTLTFSVDGADVHRTARALFPQSSGINFAEFLIYAAAGTTPTLLGNCSIGIVNASASLAKYVGEDANGYGYRPAEGKVYNNGASIATVPVAAINNTIGVQVSMVDPTNPLLTFLLNGVVVNTTVLPNTGPWYLAASIGGTPASSMLLYLNAGQQAFQFPQSGVAGWYYTTPTINQILLSNEGYTSLPTDTTPNQVYDPSISQDQVSNITVTRMIQPWPWRSNASPQSGGQSWGSISIDDNNGRFDNLIGSRDLSVTIWRLPVASSRDTAQAIGNCLIDQVQPSGDYQKTLYIKDGLALLDKNVQRALELPNVDVSAVGLPQPISIGACRNVSGLLIDSVNNIYQFHDAVIAQIVEPRVAGKLLSPVGNPADYFVTADGKSLQLHAPPVGKFTASVSGLAGTIPATAVDLLGGAGLFNTFTLSSQFTANWTPYYNTGHTGGIYEPTLITTAGYGQIRFQNIGADGIPVTIATNTNIIKAGKSYALKVFIDQMPRIVVGEQNQPDNAYFFIGGTNYYTPLTGWSQRYTSVYPNPAGGNNIRAPMELDIYFTNTQNVDLPLNLTFLQNNGTVGFTQDFLLKWAQLYQMPDAISVPALTGCNLTTYMQQIIEKRMGLASSQWSAGDAVAIDAATGYSSAGYHLDQPTSGRNALQPVLDSWGADLYLDRSGAIRVARLIDPVSVTPLGTIDESVIVGIPATTGGIAGSGQMSMINPAPDLAPGLTTTADARKNWTVYTDGDFGSTSLTDCPNAIRALLKKPFQQRAASAAQLSPMYVYAQQAAALPTCFDLVSEAQTEIDRICALYTVPRFFYAVPVRSGIADNYDIGQVWTLVYPRYGLNNGKPVLIYGVIETPDAEFATLLCWG